MNKTKTTEEFIEEAMKVHTNKYTYTQTKYTMNKIKVVITCPLHGDFEQTPSAHLGGHGCPTCGKEARKLKKAEVTKTTEKFIEQSKAVNGDKYTYENTKYINAKTKLTITCPVHGDFVVKPTNHLSKNSLGCTKCTPKGYSDLMWEQKAINSKHFEAFKLYIIECFDTNTKEAFIKIGKTFTSISKRFSSSTSMPYEWKLLKSEEGSYKYISELERILHKQYGNYNYIPKLEFNGSSTECFTLEVKEQL